MSVKTRAQLQTDINAVLEDPELHSITAEQIRGLLIDISDSMFVADDAYVQPQDPVVNSLEISSTDSGLIMGGARMLTEMGDAVPPLGETPTTGEIRDAVNAIISRLSEHHALIEANP